MSLSYRDNDGNEQTIAGTPYDILESLEQDINDLKELDTGDMIDVTPYLNTTKFNVREYIRVKKLTAHSYVLDIGGVIPLAGATALVFLTGLPFNIQNRVVVPITNDSPPYPNGMIYSSGPNTISMHCQGLTNLPLYGQAIIFTN